MIKLIACDLDGTLLNANHQLSQTSVNTIRTLKQKGIEFLVATGRSYESAAVLFKPYELECPYILLNGAMINDTDGHTVYKDPIKVAQVKEVIETLDSLDAYFHMYTAKGVASKMEDRCKEIFMAHLIREGNSEKMARKIMDEAKFGKIDLRIHDYQAFLNTNIEVFKIEVFAMDDKEIQFIRQHLQKIPQIILANSVADNIEITNLHTQKASALKHYLNMHDLRHDEVLVFGDSCNDLEMIKEFPHSFAVNNAIEQVKEVANYECESNIQEGVCKVLQNVIQDNTSLDFLKAFKKT